MKILLLLSCILISCTTMAEVYKCTDAHGKIVYSAHACSKGQSNMQINIKTGATRDLDAEKKIQQQLIEDEQVKLAEQAREEQKIAEKNAKLKQEAKDESAKNQFVIKNNPLQYSVFAIPPYEPDKLPLTVKNFENRLPDIERFRRLSAEKALSTGQCGRVEGVDLNGKSVESALVFLVDCSSAKRYYYTEQELNPQ